VTTPRKNTGMSSGAPKRSGVERSETERSEGAPEAPPRPLTLPAAQPPPDPEVPERPLRRRFTAEYKLRILKEADACLGQGGEIGALLRREGLYSSHLVTWRRQREEGSLEALQAKKRGRKEKNPQVRRIEELEKQNRKLEDRLRKANIIIEFQKKVADILGIPLETPPADENE
jgi:transposase-like protein